MRHVLSIYIFTAKNKKCKLKKIYEQKVNRQISVNTRVIVGGARFICVIWWNPYRIPPINPQPKHGMCAHPGSLGGTLRGLPFGCAVAGGSVCRAVTL